MKNSLRVRFRGADYIIDNLSKEDKELMRVEIGIAIKQDEDRRKTKELKSPKVDKKK